jgi:LDH2 family malate/lactate/ureidoglycolate dehydrogenase
MSYEHAQWFAEALVETSLMGIDTHGLRLLPLYLRELDEGRSRARPNFQITRREGATAVLDANDAQGIVAGCHAVEITAELARQQGVGALAVIHSNHFGAAGVYGARLAARGLIGLVVTSAAARMAAFNGSTPLFGTNPLCFSAPTPDGEHFVFDMATSQVSYSQIKHLSRQALPLESGWALDRHGESTTDPLAVACLAPLGGYKGQGLAMMVQILGALLAGMPNDAAITHLDVPPFNQGRQIGHFLVAIDPARFGDPEAFSTRVRSLMETVRSSAARSGQTVQVAGDPQARARKERLRLGIPLGDDEARALELESTHLERKELFE